MKNCRGVFINEEGLAEVGRDAAIEMGVDLSFVEVCGRLRGLAKLDR